MPLAVSIGGSASPREPAISKLVARRTQGPAQGRDGTHEGRTPTQLLVTANVSSFRARREEDRGTAGEQKTAGGKRGESTDTSTTELPS